LRVYAIYVSLSILAISCSKAQSEVVETEKSLFTVGQPKGQIDAVIDEASGLEASINNPGMLWTHNDSGGTPSVYLIDSIGKLKATVTLEGIDNRDWEDISVGAGPDSSKTYIYVGEIGDNRAIYPIKYIYRFEEPKIDDSGSEMIIVDFDKIPIVFPDGIRDTETLFIDHNTLDLYILSKREDSISVYVSKSPHSIEQNNKLIKLGKLPIYNVVSGDMSMNNEILIKTYDRVYFWKMQQGDNVFSTMIKPAAELPYLREPQGESITWTNNGQGYYTISEKVGEEIPELIYYRRKN